MLNNEKEKFIIFFFLGKYFRNLFGLRSHGKEKTKQIKISATFNYYEGKQMT